MNNTNFKFFNFIQHGRNVFYLSIFLCIMSCIVIMVRGFNWGLDFTGGFFIEVSSNQNLDLNKIRNSFNQSSLKSSIIQYSGDLNNIIIRLPLFQNEENYEQQIKKNVLFILNNSINQEFTIQKINWIGPNASDFLMKTAMIIFFIALLSVFIYITFRFELRLALATVISLIHDVIIIFGILSTFLIEINSTIIAALISSVGYSLNDKIVIFDRIRENFSSMSKSCISEAFNISLTQVLNRTIITSTTTIVVLLILLIFGGAMLYEFSIILLLGIIIGTISSIYIASFLAFKFKIKYK